MSLEHDLLGLHLIYKGYSKCYLEILLKSSITVSDDMSMIGIDYNSYLVHKIC